MMVNQFAGDFDIIESISDGIFDEDLLFHSGLQAKKPDRNEANRRW
jgi:hypothetical protein